MKFVVPASLVVLAFCLFLSCKKSTGGVVSSLSGQWKSEQVGEDKNGNGILDPGEIRNVDSLNEYVQFNANGTGADIGADLGAYPIPFYWGLNTTNQYLGKQDTSAHAAITWYHIDTLTATKLILRDTSGHIYGWNIYKKS